MPVFELIVVLLLILLNGFFAMAELAVISSRRPRLQAMAEEGSRGAKAALALMEDSGRFLSSVQIGITLVGILAGAFGGATLAEYLAAMLAPLPGMAQYAPEVAFALVVVVITYLSLIIGELVPKQVALRNAERLAAWVALPMTLVARFAAPAIHVLDASTRLVLKVFGHGRTPESAVTEEEIKILIAEATEAGVVEHAERQMITGVMRLGEMPVQAIMTPRPDIVWLDLEDEMAVNLEKLRSSGHSQFPVARGQLDELAGIVLAKDLLNASLAQCRLDLVTQVREPLMVPEGSDVLQLIDLLKRSPIHMALVVDEYGSIQGVVTAADLLGAIVGSLEVGPAGEEEIVQREDGSWLVDGGLAVDQLKDLLGLKTLPQEGEYHTVAGFLLSRLATLPKAGEYVDFGEYRFEVVDMDGNRIDKVLVSRNPPAI